MRKFPFFAPSDLRNSFERNVFACFILVTFILVTIIFIYRQANFQSAEARLWVAHSEQVIDRLNAIAAGQKDLVITTRGYVITGDSVYVKMDQEKIAGIAEGIRQLKALIGDDSAQQKRVTSLEYLFQSYLAIRKNIMSFRNEILEGEIKHIKKSNGVWQRIDTLLFSITKAENKLQAQRKEAGKKSLHSSGKVIGILILVFILLLSCAFIIVFINAAKRNKAEAALRKSEGLIKGIIDHAPVLVNVKDLNGQYMLANQQFAIALNTSPEALIGEDNKALVTTGTAHKIAGEEAEVMRTLEASEFEIQLPALDGIHTYITSKFPLLDEAGKLYAIGSTSVDITPIKRAHEDLHESYRRQQEILNGLQQTLSASSDLLCIINEGGEFVMVSDTAGRLLGYSSKEMMNKRFLDFIVEEDKPATNKAAQDIMSGKPVSEFTNHYIKKDGTVVPITWSARWAPEDKMMYCLARDASDKIRAAQQLAQSQARLAHAQTIARLGSWEWDLKNNRWSCSDELYHLLGVEKETSVDMQQLILDSIHPEDRALFNEKRERALKQADLLDMELRIIRADKKVSYMRIKGRLNYDEAQNPVSFSGTMQDITDRKKAELDLRKLNEQLALNATELKATNKELEHFAYVASHDLQEPLRMVSSFLALLQKKLGDSLDEDSKKYIRFAVDGADRMKGLIQDLLHYSRLGAPDNPFVDIDLKEVVSAVLRVFEEPLKEADATVHFSELPKVSGIRVQLDQLFQNLVGNALKYRSGKKLVIEIGCHERDDHWEFFVKDNGIGIDPKFFDKIFIIFQRLHNKAEYGGTGIGLAICKKIVERHGGRIWVKSNLGEGSTFYFTLKKPKHA